MIPSMSAKWSILLVVALLVAVWMLAGSDETQISALCADNGGLVIHTVDPAPPYCVLRRSQHESDHMLIITGENLKPDEGWRLVFLNVERGEYTRHFRDEVNWESSTQISVDFRLLNKYLPDDEFMVLRVQVMGGNPYGPLTKWSREFVLAADSHECGFTRPTPTPGPTLPTRGVPGDLWGRRDPGKAGFL